MSLWAKLAFWRESTEPGPAHLRRGTLGEEAAREFLNKKGLRFLAANFRSKRGEIDLIFRDEKCLVFVEVKTRSPGAWTRPARAVNARKRLALSRAATDYLRLLNFPQVPYRFDVVEVLLKGETVAEVRHIEKCFTSATWNGKSNGNSVRGSSGASAH
jgi:putative endonuclease